MIYTLEQIKEFAIPIAQKYKLKTLWVFGSYARAEATVGSDLDLLMDDSNGLALNLLGLIDMANKFKQTFNKKVDLLPLDNLYGIMMKTYFSTFIEIVLKERVLLYEIL